MNDTNFKLPTNYFLNWFTSLIKDSMIHIDFNVDDQNKYLSDFITEDIIDSWNNEMPIFISAPTGAGKNYFIQETLLPKLIDENPKQCDLILILSNRIALTRQTKLDFVNLLVEYTHSSKYKNDIEKLYTMDGLDNLYIEFDVVTICSYHQLYERHILDNRKFKYIICDECHFFTSDASFKPDTYEILKEIIYNGQESIRIYMSATLNVVFEPIIRTEYQVKLDEKNTILETLDEKIHELKSNIDLIERFIPKKKKRNKSLNREIEQYQDHIYELEKEKDVLQNKTTLSANFYYKTRNYKYIKNIYLYQNNDELVQQINSSTSKWIIFVHSESEGKGLKAKLDTLGENSVFISRNEINSTDDVKNEYNNIIQNETISKKVLISTSILDNGINIKNTGKNIKNDRDKVLNIAIDYFDRTEFIQMLGRIRTSDDMKISLFIKEYSINDLRKILTTNAEELVTLLKNDFIPINQVSFDKQKFLLNFKKSLQLYNPCAIYQLINRLNTLLTFIRQSEKDFCIKLSSPEMEALKGRVYDFYKNGSGYNMDWSRSIVDLLESHREYEKRIAYINNDIDNGESEYTRYYSTIDKSFTDYFFNEILVDHYMNKMIKYLNFYLKNLNNNEKNRFRFLIEQERKKLDRKVSYFESLKILHKNFDFTAKNILFDFNTIVSLNEKITHYQNLTNINDVSKPINIQLKWIESSNYSTISDLKIKQNDSDSLEEIIKNHSVTEEELNNHKNGKYYDNVFLTQKGILKDSDEEKSIIKKFFNDKSLTSMISGKKPKTRTFNGIEYVLKSFHSNTSGHKTFYLFVQSTVQNL